MVGYLNHTHKTLIQTYIYRVCIIVPAAVEVGSGNIVVISSSSGRCSREASIRGRSMMYDGLFPCNCSVEHTVQVVN